MKQTVFFAVMLALLSLLAGPLHARTMYIDDTLHAPVRSGEGTQFRIVHRGLRSGTSVEVLEQNEQTGYSRIRYGDNNEGYIETQYLSRTPIAAHRLAQATSQLERAQSNLATRTSELETARRELQNLQRRKSELEKELESVTTELGRVTSISADALHLDERNRELRETKQELQKEVELLSTENQRLKDRRDSDFLLMGGGLVIAGILIAILFPLLKPARKSDNWA